MYVVEMRKKNVDLSEILRDRIGRKAWLRGAVGKDGSLIHGIYRLRSKATPTETGLLPEALSEIPALGMLILPKIKVYRSEDLWRGGQLGSPDFYKELAWQSGCLQMRSSEIDRFCGLRYEYERAVLLGDVAKQENTLKEVEQHFGLSLWLYSCRIDLLQRTEGYEAHKSYYKSITAKGATSPLVNWILWFVSLRAEENTSARFFSNYLNEHVDDNRGFIKLLFLFLGVYRAFDETTATQALGILNDLPVVDRYCLFVLFLQFLAADQKSPFNRKLIVELCGPLFAKVHDPGLDGTRIAFNLPIGQINIDGQAEECDLAFYEEDYERAFALSTALLPSTINFQTISTHIKAATKLGKEPAFGLLSDRPLLLSTAQKLEKLFAHGPESADALSSLEKTLLEYSNFSWQASLRSTISEYLYEGLPGIRPNPQLSLGILRSINQSPQYALCLAGVVEAESYLSAVTRAGHKIPDVILDSVRMPEIQDPQPVTGYWRTCFKANGFLRAGQPQRALSLLAALLEAGRSQTTDILVIQLAAHCYLASSQFLACANFIASVLMKSSFLAFVLPIGTLLERLARLDESGTSEVPLLGHLSVAVLIDSFTRNISPEFENQRKDAFNDFLASQGVRKASDLRQRSQGLDQDLLGYFLRYVCVPDVLDQSLWLSSSKEVEDERAMIVVQANELAHAKNGSDIQELIDELQEIRTRQVVRNTTLQLDQSRVYVNVDGIKKYLGSLISDGWRTYQLLSSQNEQEATVDELLRQIEQAAGLHIVTRSSLKPSEKNSVFTRMVVSIRDQYTLNKNFGLDSNISTNIRHGFILREIRAPFLNHRLVTNKISATSGYAENSFWIEKAPLGSRQAQHLQGLLTELTSLVDQNIETLVRDILRIRSEQRPQGLFAFEISPVDIQLLQRAVPVTADADTFVDHVIGVLGNTTELALTNVRVYIENTTFRSLLDALTRLQEGVELSEQSHDIPRTLISQIESAISNTRIELRTTLQKIQSWFRLAGQLTYSDYQLEIAFKAAIETVRSISQNVNFNSHFDDQIQQLKGATLPHFARIFILLIENALNHSKLESGGLVIEAAAKKESDFIEISVRNNMSAEVDKLALRESISKLSRSLASETPDELIASEGGSGYPKIRKILDHDLRVENVIDVSLDDDNCFCVRILLPSEEVRA